MKTRNFTVLTIILIAGIASILFLTRDKPIPVLVKKVESGQVESTVTNTRAGTVKACRRARLSPAMGGQISRLNAHEGDFVEKGDVLIELWNDDVAARVRLAESEAIAAKANATQACLIADEAAREAKRQQKLLSRQLTSEGNADKAETNARAQKANCTAAEATSKVSESQVEVARALLDRTILRAPFPGTVAQVNGELSEFVTPSPIGVPTPPAVDLIDTSCLYVSAPIDEVDAPSIITGLDARITLDAFPDTPYPAIVQRIAPYVLEAEKQARTVDIEAVFLNPDDFSELLPGYSADIEVILNLKQDVIRIATEAIMEGNRVLVFPENGILESRTIETGLSNWKYTEVIKGLSPGEKIVLSIDRDGVSEGVAASIDQTLPGDS
ncbi:MAG: efflux RND transporter periplasmic adaptor subunit [Gammaproteobacteria bacterium]